ETMCQLALTFPERTSIQCLDPNTGDVVNDIAGNFAWSTGTRRALAYREDDDSFYVAGFDGIIFHVAGPSAARPGEVLGSCLPSDSRITDLAYNVSAGVLWAATNSPM